MKHDWIHFEDWILVLTPVAIHLNENALYPVQNISLKLHCEVYTIFSFHHTYYYTLNWTCESRKYTEFEFEKWALKLVLSEREEELMSWEEKTPINMIPLVGILEHAHKEMMSFQRKEHLSFERFQYTYTYRSERLI